MNTAEKITVQIGKASVSMPAADVMAMVMQEVNQHPDDKAVNEFAAAMRAKMKYAREANGSTGWNDPAQCSTGYLNSRLCEQIHKGDPVDIANFAMMLHARNARIKPSFAFMASNKTPRIGDPWPEQGGVLAGIMRGENCQPDYYLLVPVDKKANNPRIKWGGAGKETPNASCEFDGQANTSSLCDGDHPAAEWAAGLSIDGHQDFYLPSRRELSLCYANVPELFEKEWHWSSTQFSADYAYLQTFANGRQTNDHKAIDSRARAVRRLSII